MARKQVTKAPAKRKGRSKCTPELVMCICARLSEGEPMAQICREPGMPDRSTVWDWTQARPEVAQAIARARDDGFDVIAGDALRIADECREGFVTETDGQGHVIKRTGKDMVRRAALQIDTRLKLLAKWDPKRYGDRIDLHHTGSVNLSGKLKERRERARNAGGD